VTLNDASLIRNALCASTFYEYFAFNVGVAVAAPGFPPTGWCENSPPAYVAVR
jgi:hypothetical protein